MLAVSMAHPVAHFSTVHKRPKLSLQTSSLPISYGCSSKGLSTIATPNTTVTPTTMNTFNNTYDLTYRPTQTPTFETTKSSRISRSQSPRSFGRNERSYNVSLPYGIRPILKNSVLRNNSFSASPCTSTRKVFFPQPKKVCFKRDLEEEITTKVYTAQHLDLLVKGDDQDIMPSIESTESPPSLHENVHKPVFMSSPHVSSKKRKVEETRSSRIHFSSTEIKLHTRPLEKIPEVEADHVSTSHTSRKKRRWEWTLTPTSSKHDQSKGQKEEADTHSACPPRSDEEEDCDGVIVSVEHPDFPSRTESAKRLSKRKRATSIEDSTSSIEPIPRAVRAASW